MLADARLTGAMAYARRFLEALPVQDVERLSAERVVDEIAPPLRGRAVESLSALPLNTGNKDMAVEGSRTSRSSQSFPSAFPPQSSKGEPRGQGSHVRLGVGRRLHRGRE